MIVKEFPDIKVDLKYYGSKNPFYVGALGVPVAGPSVLLAHALAAGIEHSHKFLGATIDVYANGARQVSEEGKRVSDEEFLTNLVGEFAKHDWIYGVVLDEAQANHAERILRTREEMYTFLRGKLPGYDQKLVARTVFVPTERYTQQVWGFGYNPESLGKMVDFK